MATVDDFTPSKLDDARYIPLLVLGCTSSLLSILGSSAVIYMTSRVFSNQLLHRLLFCISVADLVSSASNFWTPFLLPETLDLPGAFGNAASCSAVGFFYATSVMVGCWYNAYLSLYYALIVGKNWKERDFTKPKELGAHAFAVVVPLVVNVAAAATQTINPSPLMNVCVYATHPWGCNQYDEIECERSHLKYAYPLVVVVGMFLIVGTLLGFACTFYVWWTVSGTLKRSSAYRFQGDADVAGEERRKQVSIQAILYSLVYFNTIFWPILGTIFSNINSAYEIQQHKTLPGYYSAMVLYWIFHPLQGALNFFVYTRQKVARWRKVAPEQSIFWIYRQVLASKEIPNRRSSLGTVRTYNSGANETKTNGANDTEGTSAGC